MLMLKTAALTQITQKVTFCGMELITFCLEAGQVTRCTRRTRLGSMREAHIYFGR